ncbi:hypothetical protein TSUD_198430 [Trifolium subterraneum]|uniref:Uncharacterized protein n=1 Tax=Trifolium subterraneum TaxID=3900 RepID=A0A2Z6P9K5_TRISU|nr:hypothetical protein TSUD_198430 [Trifolium subterraneum]
MSEEDKYHRGSRTSSPKPAERGERRSVRFTEREKFGHLGRKTRVSELRWRSSRSPWEGERVGFWSLGVFVNEENKRRVRCGGGEKCVVVRRSGGEQCVVDW